MTFFNFLCRLFLRFALLSLLISSASALELHEDGVLRVGIYNDFSPFSDKERGGLDVDLASFLADELGLKLQIVWVPADESVEDDLRNFIWKGHFLDKPIADVMLHMPVDPVFDSRIKQVKLFAPYYREKVAVLHRLDKIKKMRNLEPFFQNNKAGVQSGSGASAHLLSVYSGRLQNQIKVFVTYADAVAALKNGEISAVVGPRAELEGLYGEKNNEVKVTEIPLGGAVVLQWNPGLAIRSDRPKLFKALKDAMTKLTTSNALQNLFSKYHIEYKAPLKISN